MQNLNRIKLIYGGIERLSEQFGLSLYIIRKALNGDYSNASCNYNRCLQIRKAAKKYMKQ